MAKTGCWTDKAKLHPWHTNITDMACGYDDKLSYSGCAGCWRSRDESPLDQIPDARGFVKAIEPQLPETHLGS